MEEFTSYLIGNWKVDGTVGVEKRFAHVRKIGFDKKLEKERIDHVIMVGLKYFDKDNNCLNSVGVKFVNNSLNVGSKKKLINISGDELENRFMVAREAILDVVEAEYREKINEFNGKVNDVNDYREKDRIGCNKEFLGPRVRLIEARKKREAKNGKDVVIEKNEIVEDAGNVISNKKQKKEFDM